MLTVSCQAESPRQPRSTRPVFLRVAIAGLMICLTGPLARAAVLIDNTNNLTATLGSSGSTLNLATIKQGFQIDVATGYTSTLETISLGLQYGTTGVALELWSWDGSAATVMGSQSLVASSDVKGFYSFDLTDPVFSNLAAGSYLLTASGTSTLFWANTNPLASPTSSTTGVDFVAHRRSSNGGSTWGTTSNRNAVQLTGAVTPVAVPEPGSLFGLAVLLGGGLATRRRMS